MTNIRKSLCIAALSALASAYPALAVCMANDAASGTATQSGAATWTYTINVSNGCGAGNMTNFYIPYFSDAGISNITVPATAYYYSNGAITNTIVWSAAIEANNNLFNLAGAGVIDFQVTVTPNLQVQGNNELGVGYYFATFGFTANYGSVEAPAAILDQRYTNQGVFTGSILNVLDPPIPGSPDALAALNASSVPEPAAEGLMLLGLCAIAFVFWQRK